MSDLNTINDLSFSLRELSKKLSSLPKSPKTRTNLIEIAGYPSRENVISNFIAFYLTEDEHCFGRHLFEALLSLIQQKYPDFNSELFTTEYIVERERDYVDICIYSQTSDSDNKIKTKTYEWAILIENKINAWLYNDLEKYWKSVSADNKMGIVLTINPIDLSDRNKNGVHFINITHEELVNEWKIRISELFIDSDDRHLLFLKDYILNISSYYNKKKMEHTNEQKLELLHSNRDIINQLDRISNEAKQYAVETLIEIMKEYNYNPYTNSWKVNGKHFYIDQKLKKLNPVSDYLRFYIVVENLYVDGLITVYFELYDKHTKYGMKLRNAISPLIESDSEVYEGIGGNVNAGHCHILALENYSISDNHLPTFKEKLKDTLDKTFFGSSGLVNQAIRLLESIVKEESL